MKIQKILNIVLGCITVAVMSGGLLFASESATSRLKDSATVIQEIMATPDKGIPQELLENSHCIVIVPGMKKEPSSWEATMAEASCCAASPLTTAGQPLRG